MAWLSGWGRYLETGQGVPSFTAQWKCIHTTHNSMGGIPLKPHLLSPL